MKESPAPLAELWFVGRETYLQEFEGFIRGEKRYRTLFIQGPGGIGKTWLLRKMLATAHSIQDHELLVAGDIIDMYSTANHSVEGIQERLVILLEQALGQSAFTTYQQGQHELETGIREGFREETLISIRQNLQMSFLEDCRTLSQNKKVVVFFDTFERVQRHQVGDWVLNTLARNLPNFLFVIASREVWVGDTETHLLTLGGFSPEEVQKYLGKRGWSETDHELLTVIRERTSGFPLRIELAIEFFSGNLLRDFNKLRELNKDEFERALITPLRETGQGLFGSPSFDEAIHHTILFMAYFNRRLNADLLRLFVEENALDLHGLQPKEVLEKLEQEFFFVKTRPDGYVQLHDEMERLINQYLWPTMDPSGEFRRELAQIACRWYDKQIDQATGKETALDDLRAEQLVYWVDIDLDKVNNLLIAYGYDSFVLNNLLVVEIKPEKVKALPGKHRYRIAVNLGERARRVYLYEQGREYWQIAVAEAKKVADTDKTIDALLGLHNCTHPTDLNQSLNILKEEAYPLCERSEARRAKVLYEIGFTYSRMQDIPNAIKWYEQAKEAAQGIDQMATILNDLGYANVFLGEYKRASRYVKKGLELRQVRVQRLLKLLPDTRVQIGMNDPQTEQLEIDLSNARQFLGLSFNTLGQIKRFDGDQAAATGAYSEALEIFRDKNINDFLWQAKALHSRGEAHRRIARILYGQDRIDAGRDYEERARKDFDRCLQLCDRYGFKENHTANRRLGRLYHDQAMRADDMEMRLSLLTQAHDYFEKGLQAAVDSENDLEELENLTELAFLVDDRLEAQKLLSDDNSLNQKQVQEAQKDIKRLKGALDRHKKDPFKIYQYRVFVYLLEMEEGAFNFVQDQFDDALYHYLRGYAGLASTPGYGVARYRQHLGHLFNQLKKIEDPDIVRKWGNAFIMKWRETMVKSVAQGKTELSLAQLHPELIEEMQIYLDTAFLLQE